VSQSLRVSRIHFAAAIDSAMARALAFARSFDGRSPWVAKQLRRCVLLLWWTATFQLHTHARYWLRARLHRRVARVGAPLPALETIDPRSLDVPFSVEPIVSVIVPTYGQLPFTLRCLASIAAHAPSLPIEVIVVDDARGGPEAAALHQVRGIRLICNDTNIGFLHSCNKAAELAKGRYLYFLNNDTQVLDDWVEPMVSLFQHWPGTGAVGAKLLDPDGRLQEAGGIIWQDASGWNFGRMEDQGKPVYNYVREVDYCSGAALMVERAVFASLGGFDERYAPAYFEDTDLCFRLRRIGLKTLYQPGARVVHHEGVSHGRDTAAGIKSCQVANQRTFVDIWADVLAQGHYPNGAHVFRARDRSKNRKVILVIDHCVPTPDRDAGSRAIMACLHVLLQAGYVVKFWPHNQGYNAGYTEVLQGMGIEVMYGPGQEPFATWIKAVGGELDTILVSRPEVTEDVMPSIRRHSRARVIYYGHDLHFRRMRQQAEVTHDDRLLRLADHMRQREYAIWRQADLSLYLSEEEAQIASALQPDANIGSVVPYCFDTFAAPRAAPRRHEIIFVAGFAHPPNEDAALWFVSQILPLIRAEAPSVHLSIIGSNPSRRVRALAGEGVAVFADVSDADLMAAYDRARVAVVPLRCGAGVKMKVVEALRAGLPLVTTQVGAQGLPGLSRVAAVEDDAALFAAAVAALLRDDVAWETRSRQQVAFAQQRFSRAAMTASVLTALQPAAQPVRIARVARPWLDGTLIEGRKGHGHATAGSQAISPSARPSGLVGQADGRGARSRPADHRPAPSPVESSA
jgi:GT2 family glycosyltransferase/glycosyltransferase involved in cell wall biosynthesis